MAYAVDYDGTGIEYYTIPSFSFLSGETLSNIRIAYKSIGNVSSTKKALVPTCYGGTINSTLTFTEPNQALASHHVIIVAMLGNGESSSPSTTPDFPQKLDYQDQINAQYELLTTHLGFSALDVVLGFSMGGQQAYYWASMHSSSSSSSSQFLHNAVIICGSARTSGHNYAFLEGPKAALQTSIDYANGAYKTPSKSSSSSGGVAGTHPRPTRGLAAFGRAYCAWLTSSAWYRQRLYHTALGYPDVETYIRSGPERAFEGWDPDDLLILACQWQAGDISRIIIKSPKHKGGGKGEGKVEGEEGGYYESSLAAIGARVLVMPSGTDQYFAWEDGEVECEYLKRGVLKVIPTVWGHTAGGGANEADTQWMSERVKEFLS